MSIVVLWDIMLDKFSYWQVKRLNPESPCPLLHIENEEYKLGGAANVSANIKSLGQDNALIGCIGKDIAWNMFIQECHHTGITFTPVYTHFPTIMKQRFIEKTYHQQMLRVDYEEPIVLSDDQKKSVMEVIQSLKPKFLVISDYIKWTIDADLVERLVKYADENAISILVDSKPKHMVMFTGVYLIKPNFKEFCEAIGKQIPNEDADVEREARIFTETYKTNLVVTRWNRGATLVTKEWTVKHFHTEAKQVFDVTGAGDTFIAALTVGLAEGKSLEDAVVLGNKASGVAVWKVWTSTVSKDELL